MIGKTKDKKFDLNFLVDIFKIELKHIKDNWIVFLVCFFVARTNIINEIFPFAIVVLCTYSYIKGKSFSMLILTILAILSVQFNFVYIIMLIAVYAYFLSFSEEKRSILFAAGYSSLVLFVSKTTILIADGYSNNGLMINIFETFFIFSAIILSYELFKSIKNIKNLKNITKESIQKFREERLAAAKKKEVLKDKENNVIREIASAHAEEEVYSVETSQRIPKVKNTKVHILSERAKEKIKEQLLWQNINVKFFEVELINKNTIMLCVTVKTEKSCEEVESAIELIVRNICGVKLKCTERVIPSNNYYVLKFKNIKRLKIRTYSATATKDGSDVSGDNFAYAGRADKYYTVLCDGIGSGKEAFNESNSAVDLLSKFLYTDFTEEQILRTLNSILMIKLGDERFVTFDLNIIDYVTKEIRFYKAGAAPTYIISKNKVEKISGRSLPMGILDNFEYSSFKKKIYPGDIIVMVSDGIIDSIALDEKKSLDKYLELIADKDPQTIANSILSYALRGQESIIDDMTVLVTKIG